MVCRPRNPCPDVLSGRLGADLRHCGARDSSVLLKAASSSSRILSSCEQWHVPINQQPDTARPTGEGTCRKAEDEVQSMRTAGTLAARLDLPKEEVRRKRQGKDQGQEQGPTQGQNRWKVFAEFYEIDIRITKQAPSRLLLSQRRPPAGAVRWDGSSL